MTDAAPLHLLVAELSAVITELTDELEADIHVRYPPDQRHHPAVLRRFNRDMALVHKARALIQPPKENPDAPPPIQ